MRVFHVLVVGGAALLTSGCWVGVGTPYSGHWDRFGFAHPSSHHRPWGGEWATDFYAPPGTPGAFYSSTASGAAWGLVARLGGSCGNAQYWAGYVVIVDVHDDSGRRGWVAYAHVQDTWGGTWYRPGVGQLLTNGSGLGWTDRWPTSPCYQVTNDAGVHWHLELWQVKGNPPTYSCYEPYTSGQYLLQNSPFGRIGTTVSAERSPCP